MSLLEKVKDAGIVGAGGAGFPTHVKLASEAEYILLNGAECEPLLRVDQQLMEVYPDKIIKGFEAAGKFVKAKEAIIGIKGKHKKVVNILREKVKELNLDDYVKVKELNDVYPAGDEQVLVYELTGRVVPEAGIPIHVGCVVLNSETALNIYNAMDDKSVTEKYITLGGDIPNRVTVKVPVGTPILDVLKLSGIDNFDNYSVIDGGPMMGPILDNLEGYITKKNKGYVILNKDHHLIKKKSVNINQAKRVNKSTCEQCRMCTDLCPRYLLGHKMEPHKMMNALNYSLDNIEGQKTAMLCCQCNLCELFSCPAGLHPKFANVHFKDKLAKENIRYTPNKTEFTTRNNREYRQIPSKRLVARLGLYNFDRPAPMMNIELKPKSVKISTRQHVGAPAIPSVNVGDYVEYGQLIGVVPDGSLSATIHASISGTIISIDNDYVEIKGD